MCDVAGRLVAWMDRELPEDESAAIQQHLETCAECRRCLQAYDEVGRGFAAYCDAVLATAAATKARRKLPLWIPALAAAAALLLLALLPRSVKPVPVVPVLAEVRPPIVVEPAVDSIKPVQRRHGAVHRKSPSPAWALAEPSIQIAIPAESMFPPGAVPEGVNFIANLSLATDGSVQRLRMQP